MKIEITNVLTASQLRALIVDVADDTTIEFVRTVAPKPTMNGSCWCGCGGATKGRFVPGHDSKFHGLAKKVARGLEAMPESFEHADAEADFMKWHDAEVAKIAATPVKAKVVKVAAIKPTQPPVRQAKVVPETIAEAMAKAGVAEIEEGMLDPNSDEYKALMAEVTVG
jgi:hypothetical protein